MEVAAQINRQDDHANKDSAANDEPLGQIGIYNCVENVEEKGSARGLDACAIFEPRFSDGEWAWWPRNQLDDDGVDERSDVQRSQKRAAARDHPAQQDPGAPKQVQKQNGFREARCYSNRKLLRVDGWDTYFFEGAAHTRFAASLVSPVPL